MRVMRVVSVAVVLAAGVVVPALGAGAGQATTAQAQDSEPLTPAESEALAPLLRLVTARHDEVTAWIMRLVTLKGAQRYARVFSADGSVILGAPLPLEEVGRVSASMREEVLTRTRGCVPAHPGAPPTDESPLLRQARWKALRAPMPSNNCPPETQPLADGTRVARKADQARRLICDSEAQLTEIGYILPTTLAARPPADVLACLGDGCGVRVGSVAAGLPQAVPELGADTSIRQESLSVRVEGAPAALQQWLLGLSYMPPMFSTESVVLQRAAAGGDAVAADVRLRVFIRAGAP